MRWADSDSRFGGSQTGDRLRSQPFLTKLQESAKQEWLSSTCHVMSVSTSLPAPLRNFPENGKKKWESPERNRMTCDGFWMVEDGWWLVAGGGGGGGSTRPVRKKL
jgi:hypothetical protein